MNLTLLAGCLQSLFTTRADELAQATHFLKRRSRLTGAAFLQALASVWGRHPSASYERLAWPLGISRQALFNRFNPQATAFCRSVLFEALSHLVQANEPVGGLLKPFQGVFLDDCTQLPLPDAAAGDFPGCGSGVCDLGKAGMKVFTRLEIQRGSLQHMSFHAAKTADLNAAESAPELPPGVLHLADLGFCDFAQIQREFERGVYRISRLPVQTTVLLPGTTGNQPLVACLQRWREQGRLQVDLEGVRVGDKATATGRLTVLACPPEVVEKRLRKIQADAQRRGRQVSHRQKEMCYWQVLFSNVPVAWLKATEVWEVYRLRWQIELLFKRFKSHGGMQRSCSGQPERVQCEWYVKLLIQVVKNWLRLLHSGPLGDVNQVLLGELVGEWLTKLFDSLGQGLSAMKRVLRDLQVQLSRLRRRTRRRKNPRVAQRLAASPSRQER